MTRTINILASAATVLVMSTSAFAGGLSDQFISCVSKFADPKVGASVMLECTAADGKLSACKVLEAPTPANGFDKAAMCVAEVLPIGSKTGPIKVPLKFNPT
ncbi:MAG: hypothetical protein P4L57_04865 [Rhizomicrobium sp.]|nr:hypothetical protein [Rhizomicrobium sp.]